MSDQLSLSQIKKAYHQAAKIVARIRITTLIDAKDGTTANNPDTVYILQNILTGSLA